MALPCPPALLEESGPPVKGFRALSLLSMLAVAIILSNVTYQGHWSYHQHKHDFRSL